METLGLGGLVTMTQMCKHRAFDRLRDLRAVLAVKEWRNRTHHDGLGELPVEHVEEAVDHTRAAVRELCRVAGADPEIHVRQVDEIAAVQVGDIDVGSKAFWRDIVAGDLVDTAGITKRLDELEQRVALTEASLEEQWDVLTRLGTKTKVTMWVLGIGLVVAVAVPLVRHASGR